MSLHRLLGATFVVLAIGIGGACGSDGGSSGARDDLSDSARRGYELVETNNCSTCHTTDGGRSVGPTWKGLAGSEVDLVDGSTTVADTAYLMRAITDPKADQREGYPPTMPTFRFLSEAEVADIVAYIEELDLG